MIHKYKVDYNFLFGVVWRKVYQYVEQLGKINQGPYGGCPDRDCTSVTYLEELRRGISILTQHLSQTLTMMLPRAITEY